MNKTTDANISRVNKIRRIIWYYSIESRLNARSAYQVELLLEENSVYRNEFGELSNKNKWTRYKTGKCSPNKALRIKTEQKLPGSSAIFDHVLWLILQNKNTLSYQDCLKRLTPEFQNLLFKKVKSGVSDGYYRSQVTTQKLNAIERRKSIDALACLTVLLLEAINEGNDRDLIFSLARSLFRVLLMLCTSNPWSICMSDLFKIYQDNIFSLIKIEGYRIDVNGEYFCRSVSLLNEVYYEIVDFCISHNRTVKPDQILFNILHGGYGWEIMSDLRLILMSP